MRTFPHLNIYKLSLALTGILMVLSVVSTRCWAADVTVHKNKKGDWVLFVDGKPFFIKGVTYIVSKVGQSPTPGYTWTDFFDYDYNHNGRSDGPYDAWVDKNKNNKQDPDEPAVGDFQLMHDMGINTIRWYHDGYPHQKTDKKILRDLYYHYGIRVAVGDYLGAYTIGTGASWEAGTDYRDPKQQARMIASVRKMVEENKNEPYLLLWILGNENNLAITHTNAYQYPDAYAKFVNRVVRMIHKMDPHHPVAFVTGDLTIMPAYKKYLTDADIIGINAYRGPYGFGNLWRQVKVNLDKPVLITEFGADRAAAENKSPTDENGQAWYDKNCWLDIVRNGPHGKGEGNAIGGMVFDWLDRWNADGAPFSHAARSTPGWSKEYTGICSQGNGKHSPFERQLRKVYFVLKALWNK